MLSLAILSVGEEAGRMLLMDPERYPRDRLVGFARQLLEALPGG
jgi:hypothetical protein